MERYNNTNAFCHLDDEQEGDLRQWEYLTHTFDNDQFNDTSSVPVFPCPTSETELALHRHHCHNHSLPFNNPSLSPMKFYHVSDLQRFNSCINSCVTSNTCVTVVVPNRVDHINTSASVSLQNDECMVGSTALFLSSTSPNSSATSTSKTNKQVASTARAVTNSANISSGNIARGENTKMLKLCKPMKVYNYFYRNERDNIVNGMKQPGDPLPPPVSDFSQTKFEKLLHQRWSVDPGKERRRHRKIHGKIEFSALSKVIAERWKNLPVYGRDFYQRVALEDKKHYNAAVRAALGAPNKTSILDLH